MIKTTEEIGRARLERRRIREEAAGIAVTVDDSLPYEKRRFVYLAVLPLAYVMAAIAFLKTLFWALKVYIDEGRGGFLKVWFAYPKDGRPLRPKYASLFFDRFSEKAREVRYGAASWRALDTLYHYRYGRDRSLSGRLADFWAGSINPQAVRNRIKLAKKELRAAFAEVIARRGRVRALSVACGSAEALIEVVSELNDRSTVEVVLLDKEPEALAYAAKLAEQYGVARNFTFVEASVRDLENTVAGKFDIIEMIGFLDYQNFQKASALVARLRLMLDSGGHFFTCNIMNNPERFFVRWVLSWPMLYRTPLALAEVMVAGGFATEQVRIVVEPQKVHAIAICRNLNSN